MAWHWQGAGRLQWEQNSVGDRHGSGPPQQSQFFMWSIGKLIAHPCFIATHTQIKLYCLGINFAGRYSCNYSISHLLTYKAGILMAFLATSRKWDHSDIWENASLQKVVTILKAHFHDPWRWHSLSKRMRRQPHLNKGYWTDEYYEELLVPLISKHSVTKGFKGDSQDFECHQRPNNNHSALNTQDTVATVFQK